MEEKEEEDCSGEYTERTAAIMLTIAVRRLLSVLMDYSVLAVVVVAVVEEALRFYPITDNR